MLTLFLHGMSIMSFLDMAINFRSDIFSNISTNSVAISEKGLFCKCVSNQFKPLKLKRFKISIDESKIVRRRACEYLVLIHLKLLL